MTARLRLTLWYTAALCLGLLTFAAAVLWQTDRAADSRLNDSLQRRAADMAADLRFTPGITLRRDAPDEGSPLPGEPVIWIRVLHPDGRVAVRQGPPLPGLPAGVLMTQKAGFYDISGPGGHRVRMLVVPVRRRGIHVATIQLLTTTAQIDAQRGQLLIAMGLAGAAIVLVAVAGGWVLARRTLRPVDRITQLAAQIGAGDLHRRVGAELGGQRRGDELGRLVQTFDAMLGRLEEAAERRRRLTADVAHELCTPIATLTSGAEISLRHQRSVEDYQATLRQMLEESRHLGRIVDDLLLLARADAGHLPLQHELVELDDVCRQAAQAFDLLARERGVALSVQMPPRAVLVMGDETRLGQVVRNLLDNALRYTPAGGAVRLAVQSDAEPDPGLVQVQVSDTGPGIRPEEREHVFERFHRGTHHEPGRTTGGSGLGLAICKAIVEAHAGHIWLDDTPARDGGGAHFVVALPEVTVQSPDQEHAVPAAGAN
ncbi:MAG TPA: ATP-binding protein [Chloroflexota bacterium]|nr:ATP-binding protein [Chloroflexota bacterium]